MTYSATEVRPMRDVVVLDPRWSVEICQTFYLDRSRKRIKPNVVVLRPPDMSVYFETNFYGFKGPEVDPSKRLVAVWGDSVVFGIARGWVEGLGGFFNGYQFLNGGLEGDGLNNIRRRAIESNRQLKFDFNVIFPGWHSMKSTGKLRKTLESMMDQLPGPILCTVPTSLSERVSDMDLSSYFTSGANLDEDESYGFWGNVKYSVRNAKKLLHQLLQQNEVVRELATKRNVPLVDLFQRFYTNDTSRFRNEFFDAGHPRPKSYPKIQICFSEALKLVLV